MGIRKKVQTARPDKSESRRNLPAASIAKSSDWKTVGEEPNDMLHSAMMVVPRKIMKPAPVKEFCFDPSVKIVRMSWLWRDLIRGGTES